MGSRQEGRGRRRSGLLKGLVIITGEMSHWGMEQPSFQPTYPSDCGERAKDTHNFLFFFFLVGGSWTTELLATSQDVKAFEGWGSFHDFGRSACKEGREAQPGNRGTWKNTVTVDTPSQHPFLSLEDGGAVESDRPQKVTRVQGEDSGFTALFIKKPMTGLDPPGLVGRRQKPPLSQH